MEKAIKKYWPIFLLPTLAAFAIGFIWPFLWGTYLSFHKFTTISRTTFVGLDNYFKVFADSTFVDAFWFTAAFTCLLYTSMPGGRLPRGRRFPPRRITPGSRRMPPGRLPGRRKTPWPM